MAGINVPNIILENQIDGSLNQWFDCVPTCIDVAVRALTGVRRGGAWWKDQVYGRNYVGGTSAAAYASLAAKCGVFMHAIDGNALQLDQAIHSQIAQGHPVILTEPDPYAPGHPDWSHVVLAFETDGGEIAAADPFGAHIVMRSDSQWEQVFEFHEVWVFEKVPGRKTMAVPKGWSDKGSVLTAPNGVKVEQGFREFVLATSWPPTSLPLEGDAPDHAGDAGTVQVFTDRLLTWTEKDGVTEHPLGSFVIDQAKQLSALQVTNADQAKQLTQLQSDLVAATKAVPGEISAALVAALHAVADLQQAIQSALNAAPAPVAAPLSSVA